MNHLIAALLFVLCAGRVDADTITTLAGTGMPGYAGDGGAAIAARLSYPHGVAVDSSGTIYIADTNNYRIRAVEPGGVITTVAGTVTAGYSGDGGAAISAELNAPYGVAVDSSGTIFITDTYNNKIRAVEPGGVITTVAGDGTAGYGGDGGAATAAKLNFPGGVAFDSSGIIYIADAVNNRIRAIAPGGIITTVAGDGTAGYSGDGGAATAARLDTPSSVAVDGFGNIFISDWANHVIRMVDTAGIIHTIAGTGVKGYDNDNVSARAARLNVPWEIAVNNRGDVIVADANNFRIRRIHAATPVVHKSVSAAAACAGSALVYTLSWSNAGWGTAFDLVFTDTLPNGALYSSLSVEFYAEPDDLGTPLLLASAYAASYAGPWTSGEPPDGTGPPLVLRWVVDRAAPGRSGYIRYEVDVSATLITGSTVSSRASATIADDGRTYATEKPSTAITGVGALDAELHVPIGAPPSKWFRVEYTVTNSGWGAVSNVTAKIAPGPGAVTVDSVPAPPGPVSINPGASVTFAWSCTATADGWVTFTATATGTACPGVIEKAVSGSCTVAVFPFLATAFAALSNTCNKGQDFTVAFTVTNSGIADVNLVIPAPLDGTGAGKSMVLGGPYPAGSFTVTAGTTVTFTWSCTAMWEGARVFSISATMTDSVTGVPVGIGPLLSPPLLIQFPAQLALSVSLSSTMMSAGQSRMLTARATNTGNAGLSIPSPPSLSSSGTGTVSWGDPFPNLPVTLAGAASAVWTWTLVGKTEGVMSFAALATGADVNDGKTYSATALSQSVEIYRCGLASVSLVATPSSAPLDWTVSVTLTVRNTGTKTALLTPGTAAESGDGRVLALSGPTPSQAWVGAGETATFTCTFRTMRGGSVTFQCGARDADGDTAATVISNTVKIVEAGKTIDEMIVYPNPYRPSEAIGGTLKFRHLPPESVLTLYTIGGEEVAVLTADLNGIIEWGGRNRRGTKVAPGVYVYTARAPDGAKRVGKIQVLP